MVRAYYSQLLFYLDRDAEALEEVERAASLDPFNTLVQGVYAQDLIFLNRMLRFCKYLRTHLSEALILARRVIIAKVISFLAFAFWIIVLAVRTRRFTSFVVNLSLGPLFAACHFASRAW